MRLFVSVDIDEQLKSKILDMQKKLPKQGLKLVQAENLHFTLKFLGDQSESKVDEIISILENIIGK